MFLYQLTESGRGGDGRAGVCSTMILTFFDKMGPPRLPFQPFCPRLVLKLAKNLNISKIFSAKIGYAQQ